MLYKLHRAEHDDYPAVLRFKRKGYQFVFDIKQLIYLEDGMLFNNQDVELEEYIPESTEEAQALLKNYQDWCSKFEQPQNEQLINVLTDINYWRDKKSAVISEKFAKFENPVNKNMYFTSSLGFRCNGDSRSVTNIINLIEAYKDTNVNYRDYDNKVHSLTKEQLQTLHLESIDNINKLYQQKWNIESLLKEAKTIDDLNDSALEFKMQDYFTNSTKKTSTLTLGALLNL